MAENKDAKRQQQQDERKQSQETGRAMGATSKGGESLSRQALKLGTENPSNEPDKRPFDQQMDDIRMHDERARAMIDDDLDKRFEAYDPQKLGYRMYGGMNLVDTRQSQQRFAPVPSVSDPNYVAKAQLADEARELRSPTAGEELSANRLGRDDTARAEVNARR